MNPLALAGGILLTSDFIFLTSVKLGNSLGGETMFNMLDKLKSKSTKHEITAIPALLELIDIKGAIVTIDAMGTQTEIVRLIRAKKADYVLTLKSNHPTL